MVDKLKGISIQDIGLANALNVDNKTVEALSLFQQRRELQNYAFNLHYEKKNLSEEKALELNEKMDELTLLLENEYDRDFSGDYIIDFLVFVKGNEKMPRCW